METLTMIKRTGRSLLALSLLVGLASACTSEAEVARAKTSEAIDQIEKILKGSAVYYSTNRVDSDFSPLECQFPKSVGMTPALVDGKHPCCVDKSGRCQVKAGAWADQTWKKLMFEMKGPHYFTYEYSSEGTGEDAKAVVSAYGDLDCDGVFSTFRRTLSADPTKADSSGNCAMKSSEFNVSNELE